MTPPSHPWLLLRAFSSQALAFATLMMVARTWQPALPGMAWVLLQGLLAALVGLLLRLPRAWLPVQLALPLVLDLLLRLQLPPWIYGALLGILLLVYGGGVRARVPLYHSSRRAWGSLLDLLPSASGAVFVDLGAGFGGPVSWLARRRPDGRFRGVEASLLSWLVAWARCLPRPNARIRLGSLWHESLADCDVAFAFLSPVPMARLWEKARAEMRPGSLFVSHTFAVPGWTSDRHIPLPGRRDAALHVYRIPTPAQAGSVAGGHTGPDLDPGAPGPKK